MIINKNIDIDVDIELSEGDLFEALEECIEDKYILCTEEFKLQQEPVLQEMRDKLKELRVFILGY